MILTRLDELVRVCHRFRWTLVATHDGEYDDDRWLDGQHVQHNGGDRRSQPVLARLVVKAQAEHQEEYDCHETDDDAGEPSNVHPLPPQPAMDNGMSRLTNRIIIIEVNKC